jgi:putative addiction module killer protein
VSLTACAPLPTYPGASVGQVCDWLDALRDRSGRARILVRVDRLIEGNPGQHRDLTNGVSELKIDVGPGYRVYYTQRGDRLVLLLAGGDKSTQQKDISTAIKLAGEFKE